MRRSLLVSAALPMAVAGLVAVGACKPTGGGSNGLNGSNGSASGTPSSARARPPAPVYPGADWQTVSPASVGLDPTKLADIATTARTGKSNCLVVVRDGKIAGEWYFNGTNKNSSQDVFSATKSYTSMLVGIAQDEHKVNVDASASRWIPQWRGTPSAVVTVKDILSNDSGRQWSPTIDYVQLIRARDRTAFATGLSQAQPPGKVWAYNNSAIQTLEQVLQSATGQDVADFAQQKIFGPLGMTDTRMTRDGAGNPQMFSGIHSTCRDMARFGYLMLNQGRWDGKQIVSSSWVRRATGPSSTTLNAAYGYLWWLNHYGLIGNPLVATDLSAAANPSTARGRLVPGAPDSTYWALGLGNQIIQVDPGTKTVVVRLGTGEPRPKPPTFGPKEASTVVTQAVVRR